MADNANGTGALTLYGNGRIVSQAPAQLSVTVGADVFGLYAHASETITATGTTGDTFALTGTTHDTIQLNASAFGAGLTAANPSADWTALLANTTQNAAGAAVITDIYGDTLTLNSVSKATLSAAANAADFKSV